MSDPTALAAWLRAQYDADDAEQRGLDAWHATGCCYLPDGDLVTYPCDCGVPDRVLRGIKAKRALINRLAPTAGSDYIDYGESVLAEWALEQLAAEYADRPGYRDEWRP